MTHKIQHLVIVAVFLLLSIGICHSLDAASASEVVEAFSQEVGGIHEDIEEIAEAIDSMLEGNDVQLTDLIPAMSKIETHAEVLVELGSQNDQEWLEDAIQFQELAEDLAEMLREQEFAELTEVFVRLNLSLQLTEMMFPQYLQEEIERLVQALKNMSISDTINWDEMEMDVEQLILNSRKMHFAAGTFGKKGWQKFTLQIWEIGLELDEAAEEYDAIKVQALVEELDKPVSILVKLVEGLE